jgi:acyl-CoA thioesterase-1
LTQLEVSGPLSRLRLAKLLLALSVALLACDNSSNQAPGVASASAREASARPSPAQALAAKPAIVFLGDSLTAGRGLSEQESLPARVQEKLEALKLEYRSINGGRSGDTSAGGLARLDWYFRDSIRLYALVIGLGSNDAMRGLSLEALHENLRQIIQRTRKHAPNAKIFIWALETFPNLGQEYTKEYSEIFPRLAREQNVILIPFPLQGVAGRPELNQGDGIHPTAQGTQVMAERVWAALQPHL